MRVAVNKEKLEKAAQKYFEVKAKYQISKILCVVMVLIIGYQAYQIETIKNPLFIGASSIEQVGNNVYEVKQDTPKLEPIEDLNNYKLTEVQLPELPKIK